MKPLLVPGCHVCSIKAQAANKALVYGEPFTAVLSPAKAPRHSFTSLDNN